MLPVIKHIAGGKPIHMYDLMDLCMILRANKSESIAGISIVEMFACSESCNY